MEDKFSRFGDVRNARIVRNPYNNESRGFGFVEMEDETSTDRVRALHLPTRFLVQHACHW